MSRYCFVLLVPAEIEEQLLDELLVSCAADALISAPCSSHALVLKGMAVHEQVLGRHRRVQVQVLVQREAAVRLRQLLVERFAAAGLQYWILPVVAEGELL